MSRRVKFVGGALLALSLTFPAAEATALYAQVRGKVSGWNTTGGSHDTIKVKDWAERQWVKGEYKRRSSANTKRTLWNKSGKGRTVESGPGSKIFTLQVCEEYNHSPDKCSGWVG
ncbi:hypothetical protein [Actinomadura rayongensis]|uniref:Secreted protein n=1 Tax=Actinomadura rayongensis TaxID=1429076 RepID=A0A6I4W028_9ACTN|nr:hypothetical protein [Actinomadura rayongensis]MXQ62781.1 hypothetical protein [Actinomadura rayongensis]